MKVIFDGIVRAWDPGVRWEQVFPRPGRSGEEGEGDGRGCGNKCSCAVGDGLGVQLDRSIDRLSDWLIA